MKQQFLERRQTGLSSLLMMLWVLHSGFIPPNASIENPDKLYALEIPRDEFKMLDKDKYILSYYLNADNKYTLEGWQADGFWGHKYTKPSFTLKPRNSQAEDITPDTHFGNILLYKSELKKVRNKINVLERTKAEKVTYVLFIPKKNESNRISYNIYLEYIPRDKSIHNLAQEPVIMDDDNPSPPKKY